MSYLYYNKDRTAIVIGNMKCGYSSMQHHVSEGEIYHGKARNIEMRKLMQDHNVFKMMIIRNPYARLESFYKHWIKVEPTLQDKDNMRKSIYFPALSKIFTEEKFVNREVSFEEFVILAFPVLFAPYRSRPENGDAVALRAVDPHLKPQTLDLARWHAIITMFDELIRLEDGNFDNLNSKMKINMVHFNNTSTDIWRNTDLRWSAKMKSKVYKAYQEDFELLGYSKGSRQTTLEGTL